jgi:hypothetical protein
VRRQACAHLCLFLAASVVSLAQAQKPTFSDPAAPPFLVRLQRITSGRDICALVRGDGLFHVERETSNHFEGMEGLLNDSELASLRAVLNNHDLIALSQRQIAVPLAITERDELRISILRSPLTQNLTFLDRESRHPQDDFIQPLIQWIDVLQKHSHAALEEYSGRNNCLPPRKVDFSTRQIEGKNGEPSPRNPSATGSSDGVSATPAGAVPPFLIRWQFNHVAEGTVKDTCVVVYPGGRFRMERSSQSYRDKLKLSAYEDSLNEEELEQLTQLLDEPTLKASSHQNIPSGKVFREGELTTLSVSRGDRTQQLSFADYFGVPGWVSNVNSGTDPEERVVKPLRKWLKSHVEDKKMGALSNASATRCAAISQGKP